MAAFILKDGKFILNGYDLSGFVRSMDLSLSTAEIDVTTIDQDSIKNQSFEIPTKIIDEHRQFIWGFSVKKIIEKPLFGYGQDSSNFID